MLRFTSARSSGKPSRKAPQARGPSAPERLVRDPLATADLVVLLRPAADVQQVVAAAGADRVAPVARVDVVPARAAPELVVLSRGLSGRLVVAPDHVAPRA